MRMPQTAMVHKNTKTNIRDGVVMTTISLVALAIFCHFTGFSLLIPFLVFIIGLHLFFYKKIKGTTYVHLVLLLVLMMAGAQLLKSSPALSVYYLPVAALPMMVMLLFGDVQLSLLMAFLGSAICGLQVDFSLSEMIVFFIAGMVGVYKVKEARTRGVLIKAGLWVALIQVIGFLLINPLINKDICLYILKPLLIGGFASALILMATSKIFETIFGEITNFTLLELSDTAHPLLKKLLIEAPGSYHHSMVVANLSEAAADAIGANALLTRVGAYYHDIGKTVKPLYFTENQQALGNKHDALEPSMSRLVILNHIKEGVELAQQYKLNRKLVDFIPEHHGTSIIHYFYQKAVAEAGNEEVDEENFRYPGPKPQTKETAIVMLADSAEGATRSLGDFTPLRIEEMVRKVINNKFIDGQLDECNLTLREIEAIAASFTRVLTAMYHSRIKYPDQK